jgi:hypothetical protein
MAPPSNRLMIYTKRTRRDIPVMPSSALEPGKASGP